MFDPYAYDKNLRALVLAATDDDSKKFAALFKNKVPNLDFITIDTN